MGNGVDMLENTAYYRKLLDMAVMAGTIMIASGAETHRVEDTLHRILGTSGFEHADAFVFTTGIVATLSDLNDGKGYEWTIAATQTIYGVTEVAKLYGRAWARREKDWFVSENVSWSDGAYAPGSDSPSGQQVRLDATTTFPTILPRAFPDAVATHGAIVGIAAYQPNAGVAAAYYCWNGSEWVKLVGASPAGGAAVRIFGVVDFARKDGPAVAWYADGFQLTTEEGDWEVPLAGGANLESFKRVGDFSVDTLSGDYDIGGEGFWLLVR